MSAYRVNDAGFYGEFGGAYVPEILYKTVEDLRLAYQGIIESESFQREYHQLLRDYVGRPSPLYLAERMSQKYGCRLYLKRARHASLLKRVPDSTEWPLPPCAH